MDWGLWLAVCAVLVAGVAAVVGLWMERDPRRPPRWAYSLSFLIVLTTIVTVATSYADNLQDNQRDAAAKDRYDDLKTKAKLLQEGNDRLEEAAGESKEREEKMQEDIARMLVKLNEMAKGSADTGLQEFVKTEMGAQSRSNEQVVSKVAQQVKDSGGDPDAVLASVLPEQELQRVKRSLKAKEERMDSLLEKKEKRKAREKEADDDAKKDRKKKKDGDEKSDRDKDKSDKEKSEKDKSDKEKSEKSEKDKAEKEKSEKDKSDKDKAEKSDKSDKAAKSDKEKSDKATPAASAPKPLAPPVPPAPGSSKPKAEKKKDK